MKLERNEVRRGPRTFSRTNAKIPANARDASYISKVHPYFKLIDDINLHTNFVRLVCHVGYIHFQIYHLISTARTLAPDHVQKKRV